MTEDPDSQSSQTPDIVVAVAVLRPEWREHGRAVQRHVRRAAAATLRAALGAAGPCAGPAGRVEVSIALAGDAEVRTLNLRYRGIDRPTNVLSFPLAGTVAPAGAGEPGPLLLGDVVLAYETAAREAAAQDKPFSDHLSHLVVHGVLHLIGHDHEAEAEAARMERLEAEILAGLGIADPYAEPAGRGAAAAAP